MTPFSLACVLAFLCGPASAQSTYPSNVIRMISGIQPGSMPDVVARMVVEKLSKQMGHPMILEPRPGAAGLTGALALARSTPDGHFVGVMTSSDTLAPLVNPGTVDPKDIAPVATFANVPTGLTVVAESRFKSLAEVIEAARAQPGKLVVSSAGFLTATHLSWERLRASAKINILHIAAKGAPAAISELMAGRADMYFSPIPGVLSLLKSGKVRIIALSSAKRSPLYPDVPTTLELGYPDSDYNFWIGMSAPAKTPRAIVERLNREVRSAVTSPEMVEKFTGIAVEPMPLAVSEFEALVKSELEANARLIKSGALKPE
jgi:tripartite-type tricarboxylate transporter receptor subunit TctC